MGVTADNIVRYKVSPLTEIRHSLILPRRIFPHRWRTHGAAWRRRVWRRPATGGRWWWTRGSRCRPGAASTSSAWRAAPPPPTTRTPRTRAATPRPSAGPDPTPPSGTSSSIFFGSSHFAMADLRGRISDAPSLKAQFSSLLQEAVSFHLFWAELNVDTYPLFAQILLFFRWITHSDI